MDNKVTKKRINDHLEYDWYKYLLILIACIVAGYYFFSQIQRDKDYETVSIFVSAYHSTDNNFEGELFKEMNSPSYTQKGAAGELSAAEKYGSNLLRSVTFNNRDPLDANYSTMLYTQGVLSCDAIILSKSFLFDAGIVTLTDELLTDYLLPKGVAIGDLEYYEVDTAQDLLDANGKPVLDGDGKNVKVKARKGIRVDTFKRLSGTGSIFELNWKNIDSVYQRYKDKKEEEQPDSEFYLVINENSKNVGKFGSKAKPQNAQALFCLNRFIQYYR